MIGMKSAIASKWRESWSRSAQPPRLGPQAGGLPRLLVDVSVIIRHDARTGIQRVVRAIWTNLLAMSGERFNIVPVFATRSRGYRATPVDFLSRPLSDRKKGGPILVEPGDKFLGLDLSAHLLPSHEKQVAHWRRCGVTTHFVVYDLLPLQRPDWFNHKTVRHFRRWFEVVQEHGDQLLCISNQVAEDLRQTLDKSSKQTIARIPMAGDIEGSQPSRGIEQRVADVIGRVRRMPTILMVGTIEPRKAYDVALAAFEYLWRSNQNNAPALVIVGKPGWRTDKLQDLIRSHPEQGRRLHWLPEVSDEGLGRLYEACSGVFLASRGEGFGLPAIEAAMHGRCTLVRDLAVFREQKLPNLKFFGDDEPKALGEKLMDLVQRSPIFVPANLTLPVWSDCAEALIAELGFTSGAGVTSTCAMGAVS